MNVSVLRDQLNLNDLALTRAKRWAQLLERIESDSNEVYNFDDIDKKYGGNSVEEESDTDKEGFERNVEKENENSETFLDLSAIEENLTENANSKTVLAVISKNLDTTAICDDDREFLEQTLPFFGKYNRQFREEGFEEILNTFDERKIDEHYGKIMRRKENLNLSPYDECCARNTQRNYKTCQQFEPDMETDSDSLQSIDTARYIRSSKTKCAHRSLYATKTTTIKSYRLVKSKRDELRKKYAHLATDETINDFKHYKPRRCNNYHSFQDGVRSERYLTDSRQMGHSSYTQRCRQRCCNSSLSSCTSFEEDDLYNSNRRLCSRNNYKPYCSGHLGRHHNNKIVSKEHSSRRHDLMYDCERSRHIRSVNLPLVRENACQCRGTNKLCTSFRHLANSSSEDWVVENCESESETEIYDKRKKNEVNCSKSKSSAKNIKNETSSLPLKTELDEEALKKNAVFTKEPNDTKKHIRNNATVEEKHNDNQKNEKKITKSLPSKAKTKQIPEHSTTNNDGDEGRDDSFEFELQKAIEESKALYEEELKKRKTKELEKNKKQKSVQQKNNISKKKKRFAMNLSTISSESETESNKKIIEEKPSKQISAKSKTSKLQTVLEQKPSGNENETDNMKQNRKKCSKLKYEDGACSNVGEIKKPKNTKTITLNSATEHYELEDLKDSKKNKHSSENQKSKKNSKTASKTHESQQKAKSNASGKINSSLNSSCSSRLRALVICDSSSDSEMEIETIPKTPTDAKHLNGLSENTTFFANAGAICNSTALVNNTATSRQILKNQEQTCSSLRTQKMSSTSMKSNHTKAPRAALKESTTKERSATDSSDCGLVTSTSEQLPPIQRSAIELQRISPRTNRKRYILYSPQNTANIPQCSFVGDTYRVTAEHLSCIIGHKNANSFMRYYRGKRDFSLSSTVYYYPPRRGFQSDDDSSSSESNINPCDAPDVGWITEQKSK